MKIKNLISKLQTFAAAHKTPHISLSELILLMSEGKTSVIEAPKRGLAQSTVLIEGKLNRTPVPYTYGPDETVPLKFKDVPVDLVCNNTKAYLTISDSHVNLDATRCSVSKLDVTRSSFITVNLTNDYFTEGNSKYVKHLATQSTLDLSHFTNSRVSLSHYKGNLYLENTDLKYLQWRNGSVQTAKITQVTYAMVTAPTLTLAPTSNPYAPNVAVVGNRFMTSDGLNLPIHSHDGIDIGVLEQHTVGEATITKGYDADLKLVYVVTALGLSAHGQTIEDARRDLRKKIDALASRTDPALIHTIITSGEITREQYRQLTGACDYGVTQFKNTHGIVEDRITLKELNKILSPSDYGYGTFSFVYKLAENNPKITVEELTRKFKGFK